jgi:hypothetical protein
MRSSGSRRRERSSIAWAGTTSWLSRIVANIRRFLAAYGPTPPFDVVDAIIRRGQATIDLELALAAQGIEPQRSWVADGVVEEEAAELRWVADNRASLAP